MRPASLQVVPLNDDDGDGLDDILGEIFEPSNPAPPEPRSVDSLDDILGEIAPLPAPAAEETLDDILGELASPSDPFDDILDEVTAPETAQPAPEPDDLLGDLLDEIAGPETPAPEAAFDDILDELAGPAPVPAAEEDFDDILSEIAGPSAQEVPSEPEPDLDDILSEFAPPAPIEAAVPAPVSETDELSDMLSELAAAPAPPVAESAAAAAEAAAMAEVDAAAPKKPGIGAKLAKLAGPIAAIVGKLSFAPRIGGKREISHKAYFGLIGLCCLLGTVAIGQGVFIAMRPAHAPAPAVHVPKGTTLVPTDYSKVDLELYHDKVRTLSEGGRDMLRNPKIKEAIVDLDNGEQLYESLRAMAARNPMADRIDIRDDRVTIASCDGVTCADKSFKLVYQIEHETASVCLTERYLDGTAMSYSYSDHGYREQAGC